MREGPVKGTSGQLQATIFKKCSLDFHRPESNKGCANGTCQHTCEPSAVEKCGHKWTVRYVVNGTQREKSFADEIDAAKRVRYGTGLKKAQDFQLELTRGKRAQGKTYVDPKAGSELFGPAVEAFITSGALQASADTRKSYLSNYRTAIKGQFGHRTLAQMATQAAADEVAELLNVTMTASSIGRRRVTRMLISQRRRRPPGRQPGSSREREAAPAPGPAPQPSRPRRHRAERAGTEVPPWPL